MPLPRRMYAGTRIGFHAPLFVGDRLRRETELSDLQVREGSTGTLIVTTQTRRTFTPRGLAITEEGDTVFREAIERGAGQKRHPQARGSANRFALQLMPKSSTVNRQFIQPHRRPRNRQSGLVTLTERRLGVFQGLSNDSRHLPSRCGASTSRRVWPTQRASANASSISLIHHAKPSSVQVAETARNATRLLLSLPIRTCSCGPG